MVGRDSVGDLFEDGRFASPGRRYNQTARSFAEWSHQVNDPRFDQIGGGVKIELLSRIDRGEILEPCGSSIVFERHVIDLVHLFQLRTVAAMRGLKRPSHKATFSQKAPLDRIWGYKDVGWFWLKTALRERRKAKPLLRDFQITSPVSRGAFYCLCSY